MDNERPGRLVIELCAIASYEAVRTYEESMDCKR